MSRTSLVIVIYFVVLTKCASGSYSTKYDKLDFESYFSNPRLRISFEKCLLDEGKCNDIGEWIKDTIPNAIQTNCEMCSETQEKNIRNMVKYLAKHRKDTWKALLEKYDPLGVYTESIQHFLQ